MRKSFLPNGHYLKMLYCLCRIIFSWIKYCDNCYIYYWSYVLTAFVPLFPLNLLLLVDEFCFTIVLKTLIKEKKNFGNLT